MSSAQPIPVVCAVLEHGGLILLAQRPAGKHQALKWEFPGGKLEPGETPEDALHRELHEELGCRVEIDRALPRFLHRYDGATTAIEMIPFRCRLAAGSPAPQPHEHAAVAWAPPARLADYDLSAADLPIVAWLQAAQA